MIHVIRRPGTWLVFAFMAIGVVGCSSSGAKQISSPTTTSGVTTVPTSAAPTTTTTSAANPSAPAWCALVIDINTRHGFMKDKRYLQAASTNSQIQQAIADEGISRRTELLAVTPPEIKDAFTAELDYFAALKANGWKQVGLGAFTAAMQQQLVTFQQQKCGISFG